MNSVADRAAEILDRIARNRTDSSDLCAPVDAEELPSTGPDPAGSSVRGDG
jgi:hypothetical protein